ncbi:MAG: PhoH family protein [Myxococcota bacterium]|nr:PhoH family protein [Myxococcota bacterium]
MAQTTRSDTAKEGSIHAEVEVDEPDLLIRLTGPGATHLDIIESEFGISAGVRGNTIHMRGEREAVEGAQRALMEILGMLEKSKGFGGREVERSIRTLRANPDVKLGEFMSDVVLATPRKTITAKGPTQHGYVQQMRDNDIVFGIGPAGTGKTYLAMAMAVRALLEKRVKRIVLTRPAVEAGEKLGFLPGDLAEKVNPYLRPLYDALHDMMDFERAQMLVQRGVIEVAPLAFMRGRTLNDAFVILDEAQNSTSDQMRMFLTRLGFGSKAVITGDVTQVDLPGNARSGLADATRVLDKIDGIAFTWFTDADVVRHPLVARIVRAYESRDAAKQRVSSERQESDGGEPRGGSEPGTVASPDDRRE